MKTKNEVLRKVAGLAMAVCIMLGISPVMVQAGEAEVETITILKLVEANITLEAREEPSKTAKAMMTYQAGDKIAVVEEVDDTWYGVIYQGNIYYVERAQTTEIEQGFEEEALNQEFDQEFIESKILVEEMERQNEEAKKTRIWGIVIVVLVLAIFAVGIISHLAEKKNSAEAEKEKSDAKK